MLFKIEEETSDVDVDSADDNGEEAVPSTTSKDEISIPEKSRKTYELTYQAFMDWRRRNEVDSFSQEVLLAYFKDIWKNYKSPFTLYRQYTILKITLNVNHNINLGTYSKLRKFVKCQNEGYQVKKAKTFTPSEINKFIDEAPDDQYLVTKV